MEEILFFSSEFSRWYGSKSVFTFLSPTRSVPKSAFYPCSSWLRIPIILPWWCDLSLSWLNYLCAPFRFNFGIEVDALNLWGASAPIPESNNIEMLVWADGLTGYSWRADQRGDTDALADLLNSLLRETLDTSSASTAWSPRNLPMAFSLKNWPPFRVGFLFAPATPMISVCYIVCP